MNWAGIASFLEMGGHAVYVWSAYGVAAVAMVLEPWLAARRCRRAARRVAQAPAGEPPQ